LHWSRICIFYRSFAVLTSLRIRGFPQSSPACFALMEATGTFSAARALTQRRQHQAMISAIIVLTLISLLVATEPEPAGSTVHPSPEPPLRPAGQKPREQQAEPAKPDRLAA
jgi:hypothetical protein